MTAPYTWEINAAGDDDTRTFTWVDSDGDAIDLTGYTALCIFDHGGVYEILNAAISAPLTGTVEVALTSAVSEQFRVRTGSFKLKLTSPGGLFKTLAWGPVTVLSL